MEMKYEFFRGTLASWDKLFDDAAAFATRLGWDRVVSISHSCDHNDGLVTVWYWSGEDVTDGRRAGDR